jgi:hypothetical protein
MAIVEAYGGRIKVESFLKSVAFIPKTSLSVNEDFRVKSAETGL